MYTLLEVQFWSRPRFLLYPVIGSCTSYNGSRERGVEQIEFLSSTHLSNEAFLRRINWENLYVALCRLYVFILRISSSRYSYSSDEDRRNIFLAESSRRFTTFYRREYYLLLFTIIHREISASGPFKVLSSAKSLSLFLLCVLNIRLFSELFPAAFFEYRDLSGSSDFSPGIPLDEASRNRGSFQSVRSYLNNFQEKILEKSKRSLDRFFSNFLLIEKSLN